MAKLNFTTAPTFAMKVAIPVPGKKPADVEFTFKGRDRDEFQEYLKSTAGLTDTETLMLTIVGWELTNEFNEAAVELLGKKYPAGPRAIVNKYMSEISGVRLGN